MDAVENSSRREFIKASVAVGTGLTLAFHLPLGRAQSDIQTTPTPFAPNAFVRIGTDDRVTVVVKHLEMGQGAHTGLATLIAEELDADWARIQIETAPFDARRYNNLLLGPVQGTAMSTSLANSYLQLRKAGAVARAMLVTAAAQNWNVPAAEIEVAKGLVAHKASGRKASFGQLAPTAAKLPVPEDVPLKSAKDFRYIGKAAPRVDGRAKVNGSAVFTADFRLPGMLTALVAHPPLFGATVKSFDAGAAKATKGVVDVVAIPSGVAVLALDFWSAKKGRDALTVEWDESAANKLGTAEILAQYQDLARSPGLTARKEGDIDQGLATAARRLTAEYAFPYLAHAAMEPMNCVARVSGNGCEIWGGVQFQSIDVVKIAAVTGFDFDKIKFHQLYAGGSFGRRASTQADYVVEAVQIAKAIAGRAPVKLLWTREDDMRGGYYRPLYYHTLQAGLDGEGLVTAWRQRIVGQSILAGTMLEGVLVKTRRASTPCRSRARWTCRTGFRICWSICTRRKWACRCSGGAPSAIPTTPSPPKLSSTSWRRPQARTRSNFAALCSPTGRATGASSTSPRRRPAGGKRCRPAKAVA